MLKPLVDVFGDDFSPSTGVNEKVGERAHQVCNFAGPKQTPSPGEFASLKKGGDFLIKTIAVFFIGGD